MWSIHISEFVASLQQHWYLRLCCLLQAKNKLNIYCKKLLQILAWTFSNASISKTLIQMQSLFENWVCVCVWDSKKASTLNTQWRGEEREFVCVCLSIQCVTESVFARACMCVCVWVGWSVACWNKPPVMVGVGQACFRAWTAPVTSPYKEGGQKLHIFLKAKAQLGTEWVHTSVWPTEARSALRMAARIARCFISQTVLPVEPDTVKAKG